jgi:hypothetical protein
MDYFLGMAETGGWVKILLDIGNVLCDGEIVILGKAA